MRMSVPFTVTADKTAQVDAGRTHQKIRGRQINKRNLPACVLLFQQPTAALNAPQLHEVLHSSSFSFSVG